MKSLKLVIFGMLLFIGGCIFRLTTFYVVANGGEPNAFHAALGNYMIGFGLVMGTYALFKHD